jgi:peroxiredoxin
MTESNTAPALRAELDEISASIPPSIAERIARGVALVEAGGPYGVPLGSPAPGFTLPDADGNMVDLRSLLRMGPVVLSFYRGDWCPFCNLELRALQRSHDELRALGATVLAISPQAADHGAALVAQGGLTFPVLSDIDQSVISDYGLLYAVDADSRDLFEHVFHNDLAGQNADGTWRLPIPATLVLDTDGVVRRRHVNADYRTRMEPAEIVRAVRQITVRR